MVGENPEDLVVHNKDDHDFKVDELEDREIDEAAGGKWIDKSSPDLAARGDKGKWIDKSSPDLMGK